MSRGWSREQATGIVANLQKESRLNHNAIGDSGKAFGLAQWHPDRQAKFKKIFGKDIKYSTFEEQLAFIDWELRNKEGEKSAGDRLRTAKTSSEAAAIISKYYERPKDKHGNEIPDRQKIAQELEKTVAVMNNAQRNSNLVAGMNPALLPNMGGTTNNNVTVAPVTNITVHGTNNPQETATLTAQKVDDTNSKLTRNFQVVYG